MDTDNQYTEQSYKLSKLILCLLTFAALAIMVNSSAEFSRYIFGFPVVLSGILGVIGSYILYKGRHEPFNEKKIIAVIVNSAMVLLILTIVISNTLYRL
jgi:low affinity Fe/Cu permease